MCHLAWQRDFAGEIKLKICRRRYLELSAWNLSTGTSIVRGGSREAEGEGAVAEEAEVRVQRHESEMLAASRIWKRPGKDVPQSPGEMQHGDHFRRMSCRNLREQSSVA